MSYPVQTTWSSIPQCSLPATPSTSFHHQLAGPSTISHPCVINYAPNEIQNMSIQAGYAVKPSAGGSQIYEQCMVPISKPQLIDAGEQSETKECASHHESVTRVGNQLPTAAMGQSLCETSHENTESLLPGIETLLNAIQVVEGENNPRINPADATFTGITALHIPDETR